MMSVFNETAVVAVFERNLEAAKRKLSELEVCGDSTPDVSPKTKLRNTLVIARSRTVVDKNSCF
jgi:hypothetical protein